MHSAVRCTVVKLKQEEGAVRTKRNEKMLRENMNTRPNSNISAYISYNYCKSVALIIHVIHFRFRFADGTAAGRGDQQQPLSLAEG